MLQRVIGFDGKEFTNAIPDSRSSRKVIQIRSSVPRLLFDPIVSASRVLFFEPAVRVRHWDTVKNFGNGLTVGKWGRRNQAGHCSLLSIRCDVSRYMRLARLRK